MFRCRVSAFFGAFVLTATAVACSAAPPQEGESQSSSQLVTMPDGCAFDLENRNATVWQKGDPVSGVIVRLFTDSSGNSNWAVVDLNRQAITEVLAVTKDQFDAFYSTVLTKSPGGVGCDANHDWTDGVPCSPTGGSSGGTTCTIYYSPSNSTLLKRMCLWTQIITDIAPACVAQPCQPTMTCGATTCGTIADGCGNSVDCSYTCASGYECINNACVYAHCRTGYRWCGVDGCVKGTVCP